jgi:predicted O-methyltransferase YrrM
VIGFPRLTLNKWEMHQHVRRAVKNWPLLDFQDAAQRFRDSSDLSIPLWFRGDAQPIRITGEELTIALTAIYGSSVMFGTTSVSNLVKQVLRISRDVIGALRREFTSAEIRRRATGGFPEMKEALSYLLVLRYRPRLVVETGVGQGISSRFFLEALSQIDDGRLISIDKPNYDPAGTDVHGTGKHDAVYTRQDLGVGWLVPQHLRYRWTLLAGSSESILPGIESKIDLFLHDSYHSYAQMELEFSWAWDRLRPGGILMSDDIGWNAAFGDFLSKHPVDAFPICTRHVGIAGKVR